MAYIEVIDSAKGILQLNNGTTTTGKVRTLAQSVGTLNPRAWDIDKFGAIAAALAPVLTKSVYVLQSTRTYNIDTE